MSLRDDQDSPWKIILGVYFREFLLLLFSEIHARIDWSREVEFLDHELQKVDVDAEVGRKYADKLAKVFTLDGQIAFVLVHVEIQGYVEKAFPERMYILNSRLYQLHGVDVVSLAVLTDESPAFVPEQFQRERWGCSIDFRFPVQKLLDWENRWEELESSPNQFALIVMAHLRAKSSKDHRERKDWKTRLIRLMYERGFSRTDILQFFKAIDWILQLPKELEREFLIEHKKYEESKTMPYITSVEQLGIEQGIEQGEVKILRRQLEKKFGMLSDEITQRLESADEPQLFRWSERILTAEKLEDVFAE